MDIPLKRLRLRSDAIRSQLSLAPWIACVACLCLTQSLYSEKIPIDISLAKPNPNGKVVWYDIKLLDPEGQGWTDVAQPYDRLPARAEKVVRPEVWKLSRESAGICVRFITDASQIHARWSLLPDRNLATPKMPASGASGIDLYVKKDDGTWHWIATGVPTTKSPSMRIVGAVPPGEHEYLLYLPLFNGVTSVELGFPKVAKLYQSTPRLVQHRKPILFYGTSITHGCCASRPGMAHTAIIGRRLDYPVLNLGFSGNGKMEPEIANLLAELDPQIFVLDCLPNMAANEIRERTVPFVKILREAHPETPILLVEDRSYADAHFVAHRNERNETSRRAYREAFDQLKASGVKNLHYLEGNELLGADHEDTVDGSHPTDLGFYRQANVIGKKLNDILTTDHHE